MRKTNRIIIILFAFLALRYLTGCGGANVEETEGSKLIKDSTHIYAALESARLHYSKALMFNEKADSKSSAEEFEAAIKQLYQIDKKTLGTHYLWDRDYTELSKSVVEDYIISSGEISEKSKVFKLADRVGVKYEKYEKKSYSNAFDPSDLPKGEGIQLDKNSSVDDYVAYFQGNGRKYMDKWLYRSGKYFNLMRSILKQNDAPEELIYLSMIESGLDPTISSWAGAIGLWQFMPATGTSYGLYFDQYTDDKRDPEKSTDAAAKLLKDLHKSFGDWYLALASYNCGPGRITSAMQKSGGSDFWAIRDYLPKETRNYVPQFIACAMINIDPKSYGFNDVEYGTPVEYDRVVIKAQVPIQRLAELCNTDVETIRDLNPQLLKDETPVFPDGYLVKIPKGSFKEFSANYEAASDIDKNSFKPVFDGNEGTASVDRSNTYSYYRVENYSVDDPRLIISQSNRELIFCQLSEKDDLHSLGIKYAVRASDIRMWNNISYGTYPRKGDSLEIWLTAAEYKEIYGSTEKKSDKLLTQNNTGTSKTDLKQSAADSTGNVADNTKKVDNISTTQTTSSDGSVFVGDKDQSAKNVLVRKDSAPETKVTEKIIQPKKIKRDSLEQNTNNDEKKPPKEKTKTGSKNNGTYLTYTVKSGDNLTKIADDYGVDVADIKDWNYMDSDEIYAGQKLKIYSQSKTETTKSTGKKTGKKIEYTVKEGDNLTSIADNYDVTVSDIKKWNDLDGDVIYSGQQLDIYSSKKTSTESEKKKGKAVSYIVKDGDNLTSIADKYDVTVDQIKDWNDLDGDKIYSGQLLKIYSSKGAPDKKDFKSQYHIVKKGETLSSIADAYDVDVSDLKKWNKLKSDEILVGEKLKIK